MADNSDAQKIEELTAIVQALKDRARAQYPNGSVALAAPSYDPIRIPLPDLIRIAHARDAAQAKMAAIGSVNPRGGGPVNAAIQGIKKTIARALAWFVRDQVTFNRSTVACIEALMESLNEANRAFIALAEQTSALFQAQARELAPRFQELTDRIEPLRREGQELTGKVKEVAQEGNDVRLHWQQWRPEWERKLGYNEMTFLRSVADLQGAFQHRATLMESNFRDVVRSQHADYLGALERTTLDIQKRLWADLEKVRLEYERLIHQELRLIRQRQPRGHAPPEAETAPPIESTLSVARADGIPHLDYVRFAERFRGPEEYVRENQRIYLPYFTGRTEVLDIGCGRGEFLDLMREAGVRARGIDLSEESVAYCRGKSLEAEVADLYKYLDDLPDAALDGIFSAQVIEHLPPCRLPEMIRLCASKLDRGGRLVLETPNPECLAIFATHFYLDPTHTRPIPSQLLCFYMEEFGLGGIEVRYLSPAVDSMPEITELPGGLQKRFFGGLDYAIIATKL